MVFSVLWKHLLSALNNCSIAVIVNAITAFILILCFVRPSDLAAAKHPPCYKYAKLTLLVTKGRVPLNARA